MVTRAYASLSKIARLLLATGTLLLFGFGISTAGLAEVVPNLRDIPGFGGMVTLDWVVSLTLLATAGSILLSLGILACRAVTITDNPIAAVRIGDILVQLWEASNGSSDEDLRECFGESDSGEQLYRSWLSVIGSPGSSQTLLVRSSVVLGKSWSEWHCLSPDVRRDTRESHHVLLAHIEAGKIMSGELFAPSTSPRVAIDAKTSTAHNFMQEPTNADLVPISNVKVRSV
jgi:hypothetical protein